MVVDLGKRKIYQRQWYLKNKEREHQKQAARYWGDHEKALEWSRQYRIKNAKHLEEYGRKWRVLNRAHYRKVKKEYLFKKRMELIQRMGGKCVRCSMADWRCLAIDHIYGGGHLERKQFSGNQQRYLKHILGSVSTGQDRYQLLCYNCNRIKQHEKKEWGMLCR